MNIKPILDNWEIPRIETIRIVERRALAEHPIPGRQGSLYQDLGTRPATIVIAGSLAGDEMRDQFLQSVREKFQAGLPVTFTADITTATQIQYVVIEDMRFEEIAGSPDSFRYVIALRESPPPPPPGGLHDLDADLLDQALDLVSDISDLTDLLDRLSIPNFGDPTPPLRGALDQMKAALNGLSGTSIALNELFGGSE
ncbi:MAG: hypothetical protein RML36_09210 [Anaerolineae bacterium]|nr:DNA circularization N-terminal domain-containing protein [Anaerolineae bacterium]MDW8099644.1 hypothetical protein [Anaerolineae bacterium]